MKEQGEGSLGDMVFVLPVRVVVRSAGRSLATNRSTLLLEFLG